LGAVLAVGTLVSPAYAFHKHGYGYGYGCGYGGGTAVVGGQAFVSNGTVFTNSSLLGVPTFQTGNFGITAFGANNLAITGFTPSTFGISSFPAVTNLSFGTSLPDNTYLTTLTPSNVLTFRTANITTGDSGSCNSSNGNTSLIQAINNLNSTLAATNTSLNAIAQRLNPDQTSPTPGPNPPIPPVDPNDPSFGSSIRGSAISAATRNIAGDATYHSAQVAEQQVRNLLAGSKARADAAKRVYDHSVQMHQAHQESIDRMKQMLGIK
jgi:hypothetical protein